MRASFKTAVSKLVEKMNDPALEVEQVSPVEALVLNVWLFKRWSTSKSLLSAELKAHGEILNGMKAKMQLKNLAALDDFMGQSGSSKGNGSGKTLNSSDPIDRMKHKVQERVGHSTNETSVSMEMQSFAPSGSPSTATNRFVKRTGSTILQKGLDDGDRQSARMNPMVSNRKGGVNGVSIDSDDEG